MMTATEEYDEFWMLVKSVLNDSKVDTQEARVIACWLREHNAGGRFDFYLRKLNQQLSDGWIDHFESSSIIEATGSALKALREAKEKTA